MIKTVVFLLSVTACAAQSVSPHEVEGWKKQAADVTILRDRWGVAHVYGKTDADAVFGLLYAQCEDDFERVEMNYITALGRQAEVEGEGKLYHDLRTRLFQDSTAAIKLYNNVSSDMRLLLEAFASGVNFFLYTHPQVRPKLLRKFEPWMPLLFSEGSIGGDIEAVSVTKLKDFYGDGSLVKIEEVNNDDGLDTATNPAMKKQENLLNPTPQQWEEEPKGSNGFAIAPKNSATGNALFLINPHTSFYFRPEIHMNSEQGLNAYGAVTWGQFFIYQGFNEHCGWMHTTSQADVIDEYLETIEKKGDSLFYKYGKQRRPIKVSTLVLKVKKENGVEKTSFTVYHTHRGPVISKNGDQWISIRMLQEPIKALTQSFQRTKSKGLMDFKKAMDLRTNTSNNTVYADAQGNIGYWHGNFMPKRNTAFDYSKPVDGSNTEVDWKGIHASNETVQFLNPTSGWLQNCNATPTTAAGPNTFDRKKYPAYMCPDPENPRGTNAVRVLSREKSFTLDKLIAAAYDPYLPAFEKLIPSLVSAFAKQSARNEVLQLKLRDAIGMLQSWDKNYSTRSIPTTLAIFWGMELRQQVAAQGGQWDIVEAMLNVSDEAKVNALVKVLEDLKRDFGTWQIGWGEVNRFQRLTGKINEIYDDNKPSLPVPMVSSFWGSLAAFGSRRFEGTKKMYGYVGNSFVAVVEFGKRIKAKSLLAGGVSSNPKSLHFADQAALYCTANFKDVLFYKEDVLKNKERQYHPGN
ncbi:MAG: penicillin acylase family protein [Flammeovirgaceae bacterium]